MYDMKTVVIFIICILIISIQGYKLPRLQIPTRPPRRYEFNLPLSKQYQTECRNQQRLKKSDVTEMEKPRLIWEAMTKKEKCYLSCMLEKNDVVIDNGKSKIEKLNTTKITAMMPTDVANNVKYYINRLTKVCHFLLIDDCARNFSTYLIVMHILEKYRGIRVNTIFKPRYSEREIKEILQPCCKDDICSTLREI